MAMDFYDESIKEHPVTPEFIYRNYRKPTYNFEPTYDPTTVPFACCEMGGGMTVFYKYRFQLPYHSVEAMANIKVAGVVTSLVITYFMADLILWD